MLRPTAALAAALTLSVAASVAACTADEEEPAGHTHGSGVAMVSLPVGDGTQAEEVGYSLEDVALPRTAGRRGEVTFRVQTFRGSAQTAFLTEQTKKLHLYVVRDDLEVFRHLHPTMAKDGTWTAPVVLPTGGDYRVIAEFVAEDDGGNGDHVILGKTVSLTGPADDPGAVADPVVRVRVDQAPRAGNDGRMRLRVTDAADRPVRLETFLGVYAHVTGFQEQTGAMVHLHPLSDPTVTEDGSSLEFHSEIDEAGDYRMFVQVRVDGFVHTVPVELTVA